MIDPPNDADAPAHPVRADNAMLAEYERRGKTNGPTLPPIAVPDAARVAMPPWLGDERFHASHRAVLLLKDRDYYARHGWGEDAEGAPDWGARWEYLYPHRCDDGRWGLFPQSQYRKRAVVAWCHGALVDGAAPGGAKARPKRLSLIHI